MYDYSTNPEDPNYCEWPDTLDIGNQHFWDIIYMHILNDMYYKCEFVIPFCHDESAPAMFKRFTEIKKSPCMKAVFNPLTGSTEIRPCETEALCVIEYEVCIGLEDAIFTKLGSYEIGNSGCPRKVVGVPGISQNPQVNYVPGTCFNPCY